MRVREKAEVFVNLALVGVHFARLDLFDCYRAPGILRLEERVDERDIAPGDRAVHLRFRAGADAFREFMVLQGEDFAVRHREVVVVRPDALAAEQPRRNGAEAITRRVVEDTLVPDVRAVIEDQPDRLAVAVAGRDDRTLRAVDDAAVVAAGRGPRGG